jgi:hypothetical protein
MEEAFEEGQGPHRAVEPVMMMMMMIKWNNMRWMTHVTSMREM